MTTKDETLEDGITVVPRHPVDPATQGKICSAESKPPEGYLKGRADAEPKVTFEDDGWYTVEFEGRVSRFHPEAKG